MSDNVSITKANSYGAVQGGVAGDIDVGGTNARGSGGMGSDCCSVGDQFVIDRVGISRAEDDGLAHGGAEDEDNIAHKNDAGSAGARTKGGIGNNYGLVGGRVMIKGCIGHSGRSGGLQSSPVGVGGSEQLMRVFTPRCLPPNHTRAPALS